MSEYFLGQICAVDGLHRHFVMERDEWKGERAESRIVEPELWDELQYIAWMESGQIVAAKGIIAAGLPLIMRAVVVPVIFGADDAPAT